MAEDDSLRRYRDIRDFSATGEPRGDQKRGAHGTEELPSYVVQIHEASTTHFDFRLEVDGVLKSWAVPKGPSVDPRDKRLAVPTEDHPLEYREYEGVIGSGQYGSGAVIVWDSGTYRPLGKGGTAEDTVSFAKALAKGHASFWLDGAKLKGGYTLTRFRGGPDHDHGDQGHTADGKEAWLLVKRSDAKAVRKGSSTPDPRRARSARSGRTLHQVRRDGTAGEGDEAAVEGEAGAVRGARGGGA